MTLYPFWELNGPYLFKDESLHPRMLCAKFVVPEKILQHCQCIFAICAKFDWTWPSGSGEDAF